MKRIFFISLLCFSAQCLAWENTLSEAEKEKLRQTCQSDWPVLVYDNFPSAETTSFPTIDLNGDQIPDIFHGVFVEKLVQLSGYRVERFNMGGPLSLPEFKRDFDKILKDIKAGKKYSRINISQELPLPIEFLASGMKNANPDYPEVTASNLDVTGDDVLEALWQEVPQFMIQEIYQLFKEINDQGVQIVTIAGNHGPDHINLLSLMPGVISVGNKNLGQAKHPTSSDNSLVKIWKTGVHVSREVDGGYDIDGDGQWDFQESMLETAGEGPVQFLSGEKLSDHLISVPKAHRDHMEELARSKSSPNPNAGFLILPPGLYSTQEVASLPFISEQFKKLFLQSGSYVYFGGRGSIGSITFFESHNGRIIFDPLGTKEWNQKSSISGTSFAGPVACQKE